MMGRIRDATKSSVGLECHNIPGAGASNISLPRRFKKANTI